MSIVARQRVIVLVLMLLGACVFTAGIHWGLPSRAFDPYLFGTREPWTGQQILSLAPEWSDPSRGADVDANPLAARDRPVVLNDTDAKRAEILRRYRLFSYQPDEMITFRALADMNPGEWRLDPKLYQYGGLWVYPVGALLRAASMFGLVTLRGDVAYYLDHPEAFGRFYVVARLYTVAWGVVGIWAVFWIARRATGSLIAATGAAAIYICTPVVVNMAHEAKPHLPGAVLMLLAIVAATKYVERGTPRWWVLAGGLCGAATGMVLSAAVVFVVVPVMAMLRADTWRRRALVVAGGVVVGAVIYVATNPYVAINLLTNRALLASNFANTGAMYDVHPGDGFTNAVKLIREGASLGVAVAGALGVVVLLVRALRTRHLHPLAWLVAAPALAVTVQFVALAAGKPGEYGRFALLPGVALATAAACATAVISRRAVDRVAMIALLVALAAFPSWFYLRGFVQDASEQPRRMDDAYWLSLLQRAGGRTLAVYAEPAPYSLPPVDLFQWNLVLLPRDFDLARDPTNADVIVRAVDELGHNGAAANGFVRHSIVGLSDVFPTRISWADKPFEVWVRPALIERLQHPSTTQPTSP